MSNPKLPFPLHAPDGEPKKPKVGGPEGLEEAANEPRVESPAPAPVRADNLLAGFNFDFGAHTDDAFGSAREEDSEITASALQTYQAKATPKPTSPEAMAARAARARTASASAVLDFDVDLHALGLRSREHLITLGLYTTKTPSVSRQGVPEKMSRDAETALLLVPPAPIPAKMVLAAAASIQIPQQVFVELSELGLLTTQNGLIGLSETGLRAADVCRMKAEDPIMASDLRLSAAQAAVLEGGMPTEAWTKTLAQDLLKGSESQAFAYHKAELAAYAAYSFLDATITRMSEGEELPRMPQGLDAMAHAYRMALPDDLRGETEVHLQRLIQAQAVFGFIDRMVAARKEGIPLDDFVASPDSYRSLFEDAPGFTTGQAVAAKAAMVGLEAFGEDATPKDALKIVKAVLAAGGAKNPGTSIESLSMFKEAPAILVAALLAEEGATKIMGGAVAAKDAIHLLRNMVRPTLAWNNGDVANTVDDLVECSERLGHKLMPGQILGLTRFVRDAAEMDHSFKDLFTPVTLADMAPEDRRQAVADIITTACRDWRGDDPDLANGLVWTVARMSHSDGDLDGCVEAAMAAEAIANLTSDKVEKRVMEIRSHTMYEMLLEVTHTPVSRETRAAYRDAFLQGARNKGEGNESALRAMRRIVDIGKLENYTPPSAWATSLESLALQAFVHNAGLSVVREVITDEILKKATSNSKSNQGVGPLDEEAGLSMATPEKGWKPRNLRSAIETNAERIGPAWAVAVLYDPERTMFLPIADDQDLKALAEAAPFWGKAWVVDLTPSGSPEPQVLPLVESSAKDGFKINTEDTSWLLGDLTAAPDEASKVLVTLEAAHLQPRYLHMESYTESEEARKFAGTRE